MRDTNTAFWFFLGIATLLSRQPKTEAQFMLQSERSDGIVRPVLIDSAAPAGRQSSWFKAGERPSPNLPALSPRLLITGDREGKTTTAMASRLSFCAASFSRGKSPKSGRTGLEMPNSQGSSTPPNAKQQDQGVVKIDVSAPSSLSLAINGCCCWLLSLARRTFHTRRTPI
jgi:hypothetical protein